MEFEKELLEQALPLSKYLINTDIVSDIFE